MYEMISQIKGNIIKILIIKICQTVVGWFDAACILMLNTGSQNMVACNVRISCIPSDAKEPLLPHLTGQ